MQITPSNSLTQCTVDGSDHQPSGEVVRECIRRCKRPSSLYLHVPFCFHKCGYCDFYSIVDNAHRQEVFIHALNAEFQAMLALTELWQPSTIFIGGGTPTLLEIDRWRELLDHLANAGVTEKILEFTVEANPETVTPDLIKVLREGGVNRVSIGCQTFNKTHLQTLERWHEPASVVKAVECFRDAGINNINLDLIYAIPGQSVRQVAEDLDQAVALKPDHLSCYSLTFEPNTALTQLRDLGKVMPPDEETDRAMFSLVMERLAAAGFEQYEISNWSRQSNDSNYQCLHNLMYWRNANWIGIGPSASSHIDGVRWKNDPHLGRYITANGSPQWIDIEQLPKDRQIGEQFMLGLRLSEGVPSQWIDEVLDASDPRRLEIELLIEQHLLEKYNDYIRLSLEGKFLANAVIERLL